MRAREFLRDECGSELAEYAIVLAVFTLICVVAVRVIGVTANARVETDETNYTNAYVNGY